MSKALINDNGDSILRFFCPNKDFSRWLWLFTCPPMRTQAGRTTLSLQQSRWFLSGEKTQERTQIPYNHDILIISSKYPHNIKSHSNLFRQLHFRSPPWSIRRSLFAVRGWPQIHLIGEYIWYWSQFKLPKQMICRTNAGCLNSSLTRMCGKVELIPKVTFGCVGGILCNNAQKQFEIWRRKNPQVPNEETCFQVSQVLSSLPSRRNIKRLLSLGWISQWIRWSQWS